MGLSRSEIEDFERLLRTNEIVIVGTWWCAYTAAARGRAPNHAYVEASPDLRAYIKGEYRHTQVPVVFIWGNYRGGSDAI